MINLEINVREFVLIQVGVYMLAQLEPTRKECLALYEKLFKQTEAMKGSKGIIP